MTVIPDSALAECVAVIGRTGSGKSYTSRGLAERLLDKGERLCVIDPTGVWWGLRLNKDGKRAGYPVVVFGGDYADVQIGEASGAPLAELIAGRNLPCVVDLSNFTIGGRTRFLTAFLETLYQKNPRTPLTLIVDEADIVAPQRIQPDQTVMFSRLEQIVRRGRVRGFRPWLITQRPAELHKSVLSQAATLIALKLTAPQDRKPVREWVAGHADEDHGRRVLDSLAGLKRGEGWIWCPGADLLEQAQFPKIKTYDSMRTPEVGESHPAPASLSEVDLTVIQEGLKTVEAEIAANDPRKLKARIAELERASLRAPAPLDPAAVETAKRDGYVAGYGDAVRALIGSLRDPLRKVREIADACDAELSRLGSTTPASAPVVRAARAKPAPVPRATAGNGHATELTPSARKIVDAIHGAYPVRLTFAAAAARAGISRRSSAYGRYEREVAECTEVEHVDGHFRSAPGFANPVAASGDPVETWAARLPPSFASMLRAIAQSAVPIDRKEIAVRANVSPTSSGLAKGLGELVDLAIVEHADGLYRLADGLR